MTDFDLNAGALAPVADEVTLTEGIVVEGRIPDELDGILLRNGPNPGASRFEGRTMLDWWTGPGMIHGVAIAGGAVTWYRNRWSGAAVGNANVNVIAFAGAVLALGEGDLPVRLDRDLTPGPQTDFDGQLPNGMMAHPKLDPSTGDLHFFRADWLPPFLVVGSMNQDQRVTSLRQVELDRPVMMHDFAITEHHDVILDLNVGLDPALLELGVPLPLRWFDEHRTRLGVVPRDGSPVRWFEIEPCFIQHVVNAYERVGERDESPVVVLEAVRYPFFLRFDPTGQTHVANPLGRLWRYELDLGTGTVRETQLDDAAVELPRIDERVTGRPHRYVYAVEQPTDREMRGLVRYDLSADRRERFAVDGPDQNSEAVFVPTGAEEGQGLLLSCVYRAADDTTDVVVIDGEDLAGPPLARIRLPRRIPAGFHGTWMDHRPAAASPRVANEGLTMYSPRRSGL